MLYQTSYPVKATSMAALLGLPLLAFAAGVLLLLAGASDAWPLRPGLVGLLAILASAWLARRHWQRQPADVRTGSPERALWHGLASYGLLSGHLMATIAWLGPDFDLHGRIGHALAIDNWILILGALASYWIARDPEPRRDERDAQLAARALAATHGGLLAMLAALAIALGLGLVPALARASQPLVAQLLMLVLLLQALLYHGLRLWLYRRDAVAGLDPA
jgi:hypothetical protein